MDPNYVQSQVAPSESSGGTVGGCRRQCRASWSSCLGNKQCLSRDSVCGTECDDVHDFCEMKCRPPAPLSSGQPGPWAGNPGPWGGGSGSGPWGGG